MTSPDDVQEVASSLVIEIVNLLLRGDRDGAIEVVERLAAAMPDDGTTLFMMGVIAHSMNDNGRAIALITEALERGPEWREFADTLAVLHTREGHIADGLYYAKLAGTLDPHPFLGTCLPGDLTNYFQATENIQLSEHQVAAMRHCANRNFLRAIQEADREIRVNPRNGAAYGILGQACLASGDALRAVEAFRAAVHLEPTQPAHSAMLARALVHSGAHWEAVGCFRSALERDPESIGLPHVAMAEAALLGDDGMSIVRSFRQGLADRLRAADIERSPGPQASTGPRPFRFGFLCNTLFLHEHATMLLALLPCLPKWGVRASLYQESTASDSTTTALKAMADGYRVVHNIDDDTFAAIIEGDGVDILFDLCNPSEGGRLPVLARHPAAFQAGWLGSLGGAGLPCLDAVLSDPVLRSADEAELGPDQKLVVLDRGIFVTSPNGLFPEPGDLPLLESGAVTFGAEADLGALTPPTVSAWVRILEAVPQSRLLLTGPCALTPAARERTLACFADFGAITRVAFWDGQPPSVGDTSYFAAIDVFLDNATASRGLMLADMLWMGVPVLSLAGRTRVSRLGASLLASAGRPEWSGESVETLAEVARALARDAGQLAGIRSGLRDQVARSSLFDPAGFARGLLEAILPAAPEIVQRRIAELANP